MAVRLWTALALLVAVFGMHGLQCTSAAVPAHHAAMGAVAQLSVPVVAMAADDAGIPVPALMPAGQHATAAAARQPGTGHDGTGHLWTVCLAVLAAGLAAMLALLVRRVIGLTTPGLPPARTRARGSLPLPRPPDLHSLCLLRT